MPRASHLLQEGGGQRGPERISDVRTGAEPWGSGQCGNAPNTMSRPCSAFSFAENQEMKGLLLSNCAAAHVKTGDELLRVGFHHVGRRRRGPSTPRGARPKAGKDSDLSRERLAL